MDCQILLIYLTLQVLTNLYYRKHQWHRCQLDSNSFALIVYCCWMSTVKISLYSFLINNHWHLMMRWKLDHQFENCGHPILYYVSYNSFWCCNTIYAFHYTLPIISLQKSYKKTCLKKKWFAIKITIVICICWCWHSWFNTNFSQNTCALLQRLFFLMC